MFRLGPPRCIHKDTDVLLCGDAAGQTLIVFERPIPTVRYMTGLCDDEAILEEMMKVVQLAQFPPGLLPLCLSYGTEGEWKVAEIADDMKSEVEWKRMTLKVHPTGLTMMLYNEQHISLSWISTCKGETFDLIYDVRDFTGSSWCELLSDQDLMLISMNTPEVGFGIIDVNNASGCSSKVISHDEVNPFFVVLDQHLVAYWSTTVDLSQPEKDLKVAPVEAHRGKLPYNYLIFCRYVTQRMDRLLSVVHLDLRHVLLLGEYKGTVIAELWVLTDPKTGNMEVRQVDFKLNSTSFHCMPHALQTRPHMWELILSTEALYRIPLHILSCPCKYATLL